MSDPNPRPFSRWDALFASLTILGLFAAAVMG